MKNDNSILQWLEDWYSGNCNEDWEHSFGIKIDTLDNPGWIVVIDLEDTKYKGITSEPKSFSNSEDDWYEYKVENKKYTAAGDKHKLRILLESFRDIIVLNDIQ
jgi:hypothetical protein